MDHEKHPEILDRKGLIPWVDNVPKFLDLYKCDQYKTTIMYGDWRPIASEQIHAKNIQFTLDDRYIAFDICGDNRLIFIDWEDLPNLIDNKTKIQRMKQFRDKNLKIIDYLR